MERPLLRALRVPCVLLIDEIDRADSEFEAFLLEFLSDFQITIPELGTVSAVERPIVVMTSNRTRELHDALKRRCLYHWIAFPDAARERAIIDAKVPGLAEDAAQALVAAVTGVRALRLIKPPGIAETIEWGQAAKVLSDEGSAWPRRAAALARAAAQGAGGHRGSAGPRRGARVLNPIEGFLAEWAPIPEKRIDFLTALRDDPLPDLTRLYWLARVTLVTRLEDVPAFDALFATWFKGAPATVEPREEGESEAPPDSGGSRRAAAAADRRGHREGRERPRAAQPPRLRRRPPRTWPSCARRCASTSRRSARAGAAPRAAARPSTCAARCAPRPAPARSPSSPAATARSARARCWC